MSLKLSHFICAYASFILLSANTQEIAFDCLWKVNLEVQFVHDSVRLGNDCARSGAAWKRDELPEAATQLRLWINQISLWK